MKATAVGRPVGFSGCQQFHDVPSLTFSPKPHARARCGPRSMTSKYVLSQAGSSWAASFSNIADHPDGSAASLGSDCCLGDLGMEDQLAEVL